MAQSVLPVVIPLSNDAEWCAVSGRYQKLRAELAALERQVAETLSEIHRDLSGRNQENTAMHAEQLVAGEDDFASGDVFEALNSRLIRLRQRCAVFRAAVLMQRTKLSEIRAARSAVAGQAIGQDHRAAVARIVDAARALETAIEHQSAVRDQLTDAGYDQVLPNIHLHLDFRPFQPLANLVRAAEEYVA